MTALLAVLLAFAQDDVVRRLIEQLSSDSIDARSEAYRKLEAIGRPALPLLEKAAFDADDEVSSRAKTLLVRIPIRERLTPALVDHVKGIYERLAQGEWKAVFLELASDLRLPDERRRYPGVRAEDLSFMAPMAVQRAETDSDRMAVCEAVGRLRLRTAVPEIIPLLKDKSFTVRANAAAALRDAGAKENAAELRPLLQDEHAVVRSVAAHALARLGDREAAPALLLLLRDASRDVRWWAVRALGDLAVVEAAGAIELLQSDPDESVRRAAEAALTALRAKK